MLVLKLYWKVDGVPDHAVCVCVCVWREKEREIERQRERKRESVLLVVRNLRMKLQRDFDCKNEGPSP
jgi:hypothetical protein